MNHIISEIIQEYLDGVLNTEMKDNIKMHLDECSICRDNLNSFQVVDSALHQMRVENTKPQFTHDVIKRLGIKESPSIIWSIFKNLAPLFGLIIIVGIIYGVLKFTDKLDGSGVGDSITATQSVFNTASSGVSNGISTFTQWMKNIFPFLYTKSSYSLAAFLIVFFIIVALLDKFIFMPIARRKL
ncbi:MAG: zf-HC2 domain-containing protein [Ignavibacteriales bacterium]|nr:zf-HC2 domain-containing protein [Ignavibacteriales bacterium]